ncbi:hypothetical protein B7494_g663 [Chlorociboria aeruginascens]|nr:hypothetical protein B7494_g663 [Chlorociboria aeruginascens]
MPSAPRYNFPFPAEIRIKILRDLLLPSPPPSDEGTTSSIDRTTTTTTVTATTTATSSTGDLDPPYFISLHWMRPVCLKRFPTPEMTQNYLALCLVSKQAYQEAQFIYVTENLWVTNIANRAGGRTTLPQNWARLGRMKGFTEWANGNEGEEEEDKKKKEGLGALFSRLMSSADLVILESRE